MRGEPSHPVLLHGFTGSSASWGGALVDGLAGAGLPPVLVDLPGHGRDAARPGSAECTLAGALDLVAAAGDWPADLLGYSMGARVALHFAAAYPDRVRRLVLESGSPGLASEPERAVRREADEALARRLLEGGVESFVDFWQAQPLFDTCRVLAGGVLARQRAIRLGNHAPSLAAALRGLGTGALPGLWNALPSIETPTLLLVGSLDPKFVDIAERMVMTMPDARMVVVADAGHTVHLERPSEWLQSVGDFLSG